MKKEKDYYTEPTEQQRVKLQRLWITDEAKALQYFKQIYNLTFKKKKYRYTNEELRQRHQSDDRWKRNAVPYYEIPSDWGEEVNDQD